MSIKIDKIEEGYIEYEDYYLLNPWTAYCPTPGILGERDMIMKVVLFDGSDSAVGSLMLRSKDNGTTWQEGRILDQTYQYDFIGSRVKSAYGSIYADEQAKVLLYFDSDTYWEENDIKSIWKKRTLFYRLSFDNGYSWTDKRYVIQSGLDSEGKPYDHKHYMKDVTFGVNMAASVAPRIIRADDNTLLISVQVQMVDSRGELINPTGMGFMKCGVLKAKWNPVTLDYVWDFGDFVEVDEKYSTRGVYEPAVEKIGNNRYIMVMRGSNMTKEEEISGIKFYATSDDNGWTWSEVKPLTYDGGSILYSSSCIPYLIRHSSGKVFFIGVICSENPRGNLPRYPLCIAEIDLNSCTIMKDTVTIIDTKRENQNETLFVVDFSNHSVYEDRESGEIVVLAPFRDNMNKYRSVINKYVLQIE